MAGTTLGNTTLLRKGLVTLLGQTIKRLCSVVPTVHRFSLSDMSKGRGGGTGVAAW